ncbi:MAG: amidohydrolase [Deltaproteobacteria bacterium]|nr:amidohydrolase [Deltaproteobacteria bacterium]NND29498.1 amidohydrolase [Myxococcales bacterium]MBT8463075.1 amidohydrolase [Deltaproteobacteria bacterium]MBT8483189.1 amidohydrolase [Deltaproteobacteria bacterium]NNK06463.1 amidohydrolase [Myxococcales bacterium]
MNNIIRGVGWALVALVALVVVAGGLAWLGLHPSPPGLQVWMNGRILTMDAEGSQATALVIEDDRITSVGSDEDVQRWLPKADVVRDLEGRTVVPGFIEAHGHFPGAGLVAVAADLNSPPIGTVKTIPEALDALRQTDTNQPGDGWLIGFGYDDTMLAEKRHFTRDDLDRVSSTRPILAMHISAHMAVVNSVALERFGITADTPSPPGGEIRKDPDTGEPTGLLLETASRPLQLEALNMPPLQQIAVVRSAVALYAAQGFTTVQNGLATLEQIKGMSGGSKLGLIPQRLVIWPKDELGLEAVEGTLDLGAYASERVYIGAAKFVGDGSIQGYTGFLSEPYYRTGEHPKDYRGYPNIDADALSAQVKSIHCSGQQVAVHGNGDAAIDQFLDAWEAALGACPAEDARPILVHAQMARPDQLERMKELGATPSFFSAHVYYWGDRHRDIFLGPERAARISPAASATALGIPFTTHLDTPIVPIDSMLQLWTPVARQTSSGQTLGPDERVSVEQALRAMTSDAAWQLRLEEQLGSIEPGKLADLVILSNNPLDDEDLRDIEIDQTLVGGVTIYEKPR